jgi:hypothetical protein
MVEADAAAGLMNMTTARRIVAVTTPTVRLYVF